MICLLTSAAWSLVQIELDNGVDPVATWTPTAGVTDTYSAMQDFAAWIDSTFSGESASWVWSQTGDAPDVTLTVANAYTWTANAAAQSVLGCDAVTSGDSIAFVAPSGAVTMTNTPVGGSDFAVVSREANRGGVNVPAAAGGAVGGVPGLAETRVSVAWSSTRGMMEFQRQAIAAASHPRRAYVFFAYASAWALVEFPTVTARSLGSIYASSVELVVSA